MKTKKLILLLGTVFSLVACGSDVTGLSGAKLLREPAKAPEFRYGYSGNYDLFKDQLKTFSNKFADKYFAKQFEDGKNQIISPLSLEMCLGLAVCGANGATKQELLNALGVDESVLKSNYANLVSEFNQMRESENKEPMFQIMSSNSIWIDDDVNLKDSGLDALRDDYYCYSYHTNFSNNDANEAIAKFIEIQTKGVLKPTLNFSPLTLFVLMNTLYLKDIWNNHGTDLYFSDNPDHYFINSDKTKSSKKLLSGYYYSGKAISNDNYTAFHTFTDNNFKICFIKPNEGKQLKDVFTEETMNCVLNKDNYVYKDDVKKEKYETRCYFPEFVAECNDSLKSILSDDFNVKSIFDDKKCDFSNLTDETVYCNDVTQIAKLDVNKTGIEGAAVTIMDMAGSAGPGEYTTVYEDFVVNKEFGFILTYHDNVVFSGTVTNIDK